MKRNLSHLLDCMRNNGVKLSSVLVILAVGIGLAVVFGLTISAIIESAPRLSVAAVVDKA